MIPSLYVQTMKSYILCKSELITFTRVCYTSPNTEKLRNNRKPWIQTFKLIQGFQDWNLFVL